MAPCAVSRYGARCLIHHVQRSCVTVADLPPTLSNLSAHSTRPGSRVLGPIAWILTLCAALDCALQAFVPASADGVFPIPQIVAFGPWFGLLALVATLLALYSRRRIAAVLALLCVLYQGWWCVGYCLPHDSPSSPTETITADVAPTRVMTLNCYFGQADAQAITEVVAQEGVAILCLQEVNATLYEDLLACGLGDLLPYWCGQVTGNQLWSIYPLADPVDDAVGYSGSAMPAATIDAGWGPIRWVSVHTCAPVPGLEPYWDESLHRLSQIRSYDGQAPSTRYILMGDFNATIEHASFRAILANGFFDGAWQAGEGLVFTWPVNQGIPALVTLDHIVLDDGLRAGEFAYVTVAGSDHRAVLATVWRDETA